MSGSMPRWRPAGPSAIVAPVAGITVAIAAWWLATIVFNIRTLVLPAPPQLVDAFLQPGRPAYLLQRSWETAQETLIGFAIAMAGGILAGIGLAAFRFVERAALPVLVGLNAVPKVALAPLLVVWLGFEIKPKIVMVVLICFFPIIVATMSGLAATPADLGELAESLSASRWHTYLKIRLPWALPQIFVGFKVSVPLAMVGAIVAETNNPNRGLGATIATSSQQLDTPLAFACLLLLVVLSTLFFYVVVGLERLLVPWARAISAEKG
jgi:NitT/TauT family transport system permease protein